MRPRTFATASPKNREIAGLHYKSDSDDGKQLAKDISPKLITDSTGSKIVSAFHEAVTEARNEWP